MLGLRRWVGGWELVGMVIVRVTVGWVGAWVAQVGGWMGMGG